ncbi:Mth938-like domain-containing protein [Cereibacter sphaeroides]|uniref:Mth938-like domain-containing protein n=1 Tax=Cereibacter sphaeroides TaxID=1063 RepID=UPI001F1F4F79|nr:Mth938-like domain-containing protein [Cereibacter sphaeroides]MCE6959012.1 Mth938-like domain-containing protein [Cereibacter sphaeroides]MCE6969076.1 Mth938-like domain-containing protein [Cereibacter sphaeroides]MCE6973646.1 Mth938-like domain-containing protein [Cereibacter sphaeroides]
MRLTEITYDTAQPVEGYGPGFFRIGGQVLDGACLISRWGAGGWGGLADTATLLALVDRIDVLLVGMGAEAAHVPPQFRATLEGAGIGVEVMASPAACRTYNVLISEGRRIAVALLPV